MDFEHVARLSEDRRNLATQLAASDFRGDMELAESLRPTLRRALESLKLLYEDEDVWDTAEQAVAAVHDVPTSQLIQSVTDYPKSLPALLDLFGYLPPPPATQLVSEAVASLQQDPDEEGRTVAVTETREALGQLLQKSLILENASPWLLPDIASETIPALDVGVTLATGAFTGGVMAAIGTAVIPAAAVSGGLAVAPMLILGGFYWWRRKRKIRKQNAELLQLREQLSLDLVPAARAAVVQHLNAIVDLQQQTIEENPQALLDLRNNLETLIDITRRFGASDAHLRTAARQEKIRPGGDAFASDFLGQLPPLFATALTAKASLDAGQQIDQVTLALLKEQRQAINNLGPRFMHTRRPKPKP
jgi:hypothetical protein